MKDSILAGWKLWFLAAVLLSISSPVTAGMLMPIDVNDLYVYTKHDSANPQNEWTFHLQGLERVDVGGLQYINISTRNEKGTGDYKEFLVRSTENTVHGTDGSIFFQIAPVGTTWNSPSYQEGLGSGTNVNEIISIESVTVPYGTFNNAYVHKVYFDPDDSSFSNTPFWYDYIVPDVGWVKQIDHFWSPDGPAVVELSHVNTVPEPATIALLGIGLAGLAGAEARRRRKKRTVDNS
ncbi:MAG: PEP-CTERM sorting domain-containing protein [Candidatus Scalindua rubra]|uniref:PEP-CTERM motif protein n=1 Tax=Candidatus Scalindua brodae TaxID=237368 RepID=A0A0B0EKB5_9BACT|nr:MAG: PEP-CTERM motif protein [Candidatus Scalindua brodae]MBZ0110103.1 PEP-CTERM sorting domain-containing protein [Candidatus Scalindua rubra]